MEPDPTPPAPAVVAVVVTCDPGPWFEQVLVALRAQDYPNLSVLVVDSASLGDPTPMVAEVLPGAYVKRLDQRVGFGRAANQVLQLVEGASHFLFCHDDVVLDPAAVRLLVEEAFRSNSGVTTPKFVAWDQPERLLAVGASADKVGVMHDLVDPGERDQEQHDAVREVLVAPSGLTLVRADLFSALGGFDETIDQFGEDLDLSWRAWLAGARITAVPAARVRHLQATRTGQRAGWGSMAARRRSGDLTETHRYRTLLTCYRWFNLLWILPLAALWMLGEVGTRLLQGRPGAAWHALTAFTGGFGQPGRLWRARRRVQRRRVTGDGAIRRRQSRGNARFRAFVRARVEGVIEGLPPAPLAGRLGRGALGDLDEEDEEAARRIRAGGAPVDKAGDRPEAPGWRLPVIAGAVLLVLLLFGSRRLLGHGLPAVGQIPATSAGWDALWRSWWSTWQQGGLGVTAPSSPALALLGLLDTVLLGAAGTMQHIAVLAPLLVGPLGAYRAARWWGSRLGRVAATVTYAVAPLSYNALARGHWGGLLAYGATPWVLAALGRLSGEVPFPSTRSARIVGRVAGLAVVVAVVAAVAPSYLFVVPVMGLALLAGSALAGRAGRGVRMLGVAAAAAAGAVVLLFPWSVGVLGSRVALLGPAGGPARRLGLGEVLRFQTGPVGHGVLGWGLLLVAALPLFIGRGWRLAWAARLWVVALASFGLTWAGWRGWVPALPPEVALAPAAAALAGSAALGVAAFELDLPGYRFGWRQLVSGLAAVGLAVAAVPLFIATGDGRWHLPSADAGSVLGFLPDNHAGDYRVLWVGAPDALPLAGRQLHPGVVFATSYDGEPGPSDLWVTPRQGATPELADDLTLVEGRLTTRLGHLLAPMAVRYLVIPNHNGPQGSGAASLPGPDPLIAGLALQTDLQAVNVDPNYTVYLNAAWAPAVAVLPATAEEVAAADAATSRRLLQELDLSKAAPVVAGSHRAAQVPVSSVVYVGSTRDAGWRLHASGRSVGPRPAFGWAMSFAVPGASDPVAVRLTHPPAPAIRAGQVVEIVIVLAVIALVVIDARRRRLEDPPSETVRPEWFTPLTVRGGRGRRRIGAGAIGAEDLKGDEVWVDV